MHRALAFGSPQRILFTAQTRGDARKMWEDDHTPTLQRSPFGPLFTIRRQIGQEAFRWANGSLHGLTAPNETAAHGQTLDLAVIDEAWAVGAEVEQGLGPAMITRTQPQQWTISTAGTPRSEWFRAKVDAGRAQPDGRPGAFFEWSADPDADTEDPPPGGVVIRRWATRSPRTCCGPSWAGWTWMSSAAPTATCGATRCRTTAGP